MKVAIVHEWLLKERGAEHVLEQMLQVFQDATVFTLFYEPKAISFPIKNIVVSRFNKLPGVKRYYRYLLPFIPLMVRSLNVKKFDLVISLSHSFAKGAQKGKGVMHICYCHTPMRFAHSQFEQYRQGLPLPERIVLKILRKPLQRWDLKASKAVDFFIANSREVQKRIKKIYDRDSAIIHPPVDTEFFKPLGKGHGGFYLVVSALEPYKRVDLAVKAFNKMPGKELVIVGSGSQEMKLKKIAQGGNIKFLGHLPRGQVLNYMQRCKALIYPQVEDFGITTLEAMACGKPVIAFAKGGALETVVEGRTGHFFRQQNAEALEGAVKEFEAMKFDSKKIRAHALSFGNEKFKAEIKKFVLGKARAWKLI